MAHHPGESKESREVHIPWRTGLVAPFIITLCFTVVAAAGGIFSLDQFRVASDDVWAEAASVSALVVILGVVVAMRLASIRRGDLRREDAIRRAMALSDGRAVDLLRSPAPQLVRRRVAPLRLRELRRRTSGSRPERSLPHPTGRDLAAEHHRSRQQRRIGLIAGCLSVVIGGSALAILNASDCAGYPESTLYQWCPDERRGAYPIFLTLAAISFVAMFTGVWLLYSAIGHGSKVRVLEDRLSLNEKHDAGSR